MMKFDSFSHSNGDMTGKLSTNDPSLPSVVQKRLSCVEEETEVMQLHVVTSFLNKSLFLSPTADDSDSISADLRLRQNRQD